LNPEEKVAIAIDMTDTCIRICADGIKAQHPGIGEEGLIRNCEKDLNGQNATENVYASSSCVSSSATAGIKVTLSFLGAGSVLFLSSLWCPSQYMLQPISQTRTNAGSSNATTSLFRLCLGFVTLKTAP
jgi:hypothetical protein